MGSQSIKDPARMQPAREWVTLHIYDAMADPNVIACNHALLKLVGAGVFHCGVEVYGREWSYRSRRSKGTGVISHEPLRSPGAQHRESLNMGITELSVVLFRCLMEVLALEWQGTEYDLLNRNCCHFCEEFCKRLGVVAPFPPWVSRLANAGNSLAEEGRIVAAAVTRIDRELAEHMHSVNSCIEREVDHCAGTCRQSCWNHADAGQSCWNHADTGQALHFDNLELGGAFEEYEVDDRHPLRWTPRGWVPFGNDRPVIRR